MWHLVEVVEPERGAGAFQEVGPGDGGGGVTQVLAEVVREGAVVCFIDIGVGGGLVLAAASKEDMGERVRHPFQQLVDLQAFFLAAPDVDGRRKVPLLQGHAAGGIFPGEAFRHAHLPRGGAGMATVEEDLEVGAFGDLLEDLSDLVIDDVRAVPVHVVGAKYLVEAVLQLIAVAVPDLRAVAGVVEDESVSRLRAFYEPFEPRHDVLLCGARIGDDADLLDGEPEIGEQAVADVRDVVDAALKIAVGQFVLVNAD